jgi:hypothetical protein
MEDLSKNALLIIDPEGEKLNIHLTPFNKKEPESDDEVRI